MSEPVLPPMASLGGGWESLERRPADPDQTPDHLARAFARCFAGPSGELALAHLESLTRQRVLAPEAGDAALWHLEGQRHLVARILALIAAGR
ncbi:hypothetical protein [Roseospirillum parvum]|uniref:Bbp19-like phage domain-containing protein n=1 Tax=Roseospirillum parvum TaxID=83401 RepID=A0A1G7W7E1_9PROT|nr:hypothetical protein [Roseospirillum parvum]SDG67821.1 hypothetical protein SAMN05421742_102101 [Roseospirillum parvum]